MSMTYWEGVANKNRQKTTQIINRRQKAWTKKHTACSTQEKQERAKKAAARRKKK